MKIICACSSFEITSVIPVNRDFNWCLPVTSGLSNSWPVFDYLALHLDQIVECFLAFDNFALFQNQIVGCSSCIRQFPSALQSNCRISTLYSATSHPAKPTQKSPQTQKGQDFSWPHIYALTRYPRCI